MSQCFASDLIKRSLHALSSSLYGTGNVSHIVTFSVSFSWSFRLHSQSVKKSYLIHRKRCPEFRKLFVITRNEWKNIAERHVVFFSYFNFCCRTLKQLLNFLLTCLDVHSVVLNMSECLYSGPLQLCKSLHILMAAGDDTVFIHKVND